MGTAGCAQQTSAAYSPLRRRGAYYPLFRSAGIHLLIKMLRVYQLCKTTALITKHPVTVSERAPRGGRGAPGRAPTAVPRPPRCAEPRARRYVGMIVRIRRSTMWEAAPESAEPPPSTVERA